LGRRCAQNRFAEVRSQFRFNISLVVWDVCEARASSRLPDYPNGSEVQHRQKSSHYGVLEARCRASTSQIAIIVVQQWGRPRSHSMKIFAITVCLKNHYVGRWSYSVNKSTIGLCITYLGVTYCSQSFDSRRLQGSKAMAIGCRTILLHLRSSFELSFIDRTGRIIVLLWLDDLEHLNAHHSPRSGEVLPPIDKPLDSANDNDDGKCNDAVVCAGQLLMSFLRGSS
jgi:hypothetical protein